LTAIPGATLVPLFTPSLAIHGKALTGEKVHLVPFPVSCSPN
jgi:hypothetical protein